MMKNKILLALSLLAGPVAVAQNTFPSSGNVGVGTTTPAAKLSFNNVNDGSDGADGITWYNNAPLNYGIFRTPGAWAAPAFQQLKLSWDTGIILDPGTLHGKSYVDIQGAGLRVTAGNVGIGNTVPQAKLDVRGDYIKNEYGINTPTALFMSTNAPQAGVGASIGLGGRTGLTTADYSYAYLLGAKENNSNYAGYFAIHTVAGDGVPGEASSGNYERLRVTSTGDVGIGTATPREKLSVNGKIRAKEIKVETANWPDYVFAADYKIGTLEELESYIKANKHLPDMPSAKEVEANGVELGEMNKLLLKKVEELTLHLIEKDKELQNSNKRLQDLESEQKEIKALLKKLKDK